MLKLNPHPVPQLRFAVPLPLDESEVIVMGRFVAVPSPQPAV
jgi:hypothetical protein